MKRRLETQGVGFAVGLAVALGLVAAFGARFATAPVAPRYTVAYAGVALLITDNQTDQLYIYQNAAEGSKLQSVVDLKETGKMLIKVEPVEVAPAAEEEDLAKLVPQGAFELTAKIRGRVAKLNDDSVLFQVTSILEVEQGVPMLSKLPHTNRLFKNAGVVRSEVPAVIEIQKDRIERVEAIKKDDLRP